MTGCKVEDLSPIVDLPRLSHLYVAKNPLSERSMEALIPQLKSRSVVVTFALPTREENPIPHFPSQAEQSPGFFSWGKREAKFQDPNLVKLFREVLEQPSGSIRSSDLARVEILSASCRNLRNLEGLQSCRNLKELYLGFQPGAYDRNAIQDVEPLRDLSN